MKELAVLTLLINPTLPSLGIAALLIWLLIRMKQDPNWRRGLAGATAPQAERRVMRSAPVVVPIDR